VRVRVGGWVGEGEGPLFTLTLTVALTPSHPHTPSPTLNLKHIEEQKLKLNQINNIEKSEHFESLF